MTECNRQVAVMDLAKDKRTLAAFGREGVNYVLGGSMAMAAQGLAHATRELDFFVTPTPANTPPLSR